VQISIAHLHRQQGDYANARRTLELAATAYESLRGRWPDSLEYLENEANAQADLGLLALDRKTPIAAVGPLDRAASSLEQLAANYPTVIRYASGYATTLSGLGQASLQLDPLPETAIDRLSRSRDLFLQITQQSADARSVESLAAVTGQLARGYERAERTQEAEVTFPLAIEYFQQLMEHRPDEPRFAYSLSEVEFHFAMFEIRRGRDEQGVRWWSQSAERMRSLAQLFPQNGEYHHRLAWLLLRDPRELGPEQAQAELHARSAVELQPANRFFGLTLAEAHLVNGQMASAREILSALHGTPEGELPEWEGLSGWLDGLEGDRSSAVKRLELCRQKFQQQRPYDRDLGDWIERIQARLED